MRVEKEEEEDEAVAKQTAFSMSKKLAIKAAFNHGAQKEICV